MLETCSLKYREAFLSELPSDEIKVKIDTKIKTGIVLTEEEMMEFIILPLTCKGQGTEGRDQKSVDLTQYIRNEESWFLLSGLLVLQIR